jgi:hypothetical protein
VLHLAGTGTAAAMGGGASVLGGATTLLLPHSWQRAGAWRWALLPSMGAVAASGGRGRYKATPTMLQRDAWRWVMSTHASILIDSVGPPSTEVCRAAASFP